MTFTLKREIPIKQGYDLVVVGGGPGGCGTRSRQAGEDCVFYWLKRQAHWAEWARKRWFPLGLTCPTERKPFWVALCGTW